MALSKKKSYVHAPGLKPFIGLTMHEMLEERVVDLAAGFLFKLGLRRGDRIAVIGANHVEWPLITGAARAIGVGVEANLLFGHNPQTFKKILSHVCIVCKALFIIRSPDTLYQMVCEMIPELSESIPDDLNSKQFPDLKKVIAVGPNCKMLSGIK
ncbi:medium-chain acyl-CoA ligase ACSF2, mitochondrial-like [Antedon mediterranea]|uniref:medium-chain acyl-CoA ligase ACSF2, mitochondrial-like n=1 Tax=Antedon mediterranea TaxID=105859 RepID=UPI003AF88EB0